MEKHSIGDIITIGGRQRKVCQVFDNGYSHEDIYANHERDFIPVCYVFDPTCVPLEYNGKIDYVILKDAQSVCQFLQIHKSYLQVLYVTEGRFSYTIFYKEPTYDSVLANMHYEYE